MASSPKVAIVHDWLYGGGAELVVEQLHKLYPDAPIYTSYCSHEWRERLDNKVVTGYLQHWPFAQLRRFLPVLRQHWFKKLDLGEFDLVISSSGNGEARFAQVNKPAIHISYTHSPPHFYWSKYDQYIKNPSFKPKWLARLGLRLLVKPLRKRDYEAAQKVDYLIANSSHIQNDIKKYYNRDSTIIHPPIDTDSFSTTHSPLLTTHSYITWGRHVPYKRFDIIIKACNELKLPLVIAGIGPETAALKKIAGPTISFAGFATKENLISLAHKSSAFIFAAEEDFGISPVEAMALGLPVIAYKAGGALDYIQPGKTGEFFNAQTVESLVEILNNFDTNNFSSKTISKSAEEYSSEHFQTVFRQFLKSIGS